MKTQSISDVLAKHDFFADMSPEHIDFIAGCATIVHFRVGDFVMLAGEPCTHFYLARSGRAVVEVETGNQTRVIHSPGPGDIIGWSWVMPPAIWRYDVRVTEEMSAIAFDAKCVREKCEADYEFGYHIYKRILEIVIERFMATRIQMMDVYA